MIAVADTSTLCYLLLIGHMDLRPTLFDKGIIPQAVLDELMDEGAPDALRAWIAQPPSWLEIQFVTSESETNLDRLHAGEREAIALAEKLRADLILLDEKSARRIARERGLRGTGLLGILAEAAARGLIDVTDAVDRLRQTNFRTSPGMLKALLDRHNLGEHS